MINNCNTPFHRFWKNLDVDAFIPLVLLAMALVGVLYLYAFNTEYKELYDTAKVTHFSSIEKKIPCPNNNSHCTETHTDTYYIIKYISNSKKHIVQTHTIPEECSNIQLKINNEHPTILKKYKKYNEYVGIFFKSNNSSKRCDKDIYILE